jgi:hypothetical protein
LVWLAAGLGIGIGTQVVLPIKMRREKHSQIECARTPANELSLPIYQMPATFLSSKLHKCLTAVSIERE